MCLKMICILSVLKDSVEKQCQCDLAKWNTGSLFQTFLYTKAYNIICAVCTMYMYFLGLSQL